MEGLASSLSYLLDDLAIEGTARFSGEELGSSEVGADFIKTCSLLLSKLSSYDSAVSPSGLNSTVKEVYEACKVLNPPFTLEQVKESSRPELLQYRILHFLCTSLQSERLNKHASKNDARFETAGERGKIVFQLDKICSDLRVEPYVENPNEMDIINAICDRIAHVTETAPMDMLCDPPKAIVCGHVRATELTPMQAGLLEHIQKAYMDDFLLRRYVL